MFTFSYDKLPLLSVYSLFIIAIVLPVYAQSASPLTEDQDGDGNPINEEDELVVHCDVDFSSLYGMRQLSESLGNEFEPTVSEDDCNYALHYLSGQCEEQTAAGANLTEVCNETLSNFLKAAGLIHKGFPH